MNTSPRKRYGAALIRHFILISLFFPAFYTKFQHVYYQDLSFMTIIALMLTCHILFKCRLDIYKHRYTVLLITTALIAYLITAVVNFKRYPVMFWRTEPLNILIAVAFFLSLLLLRKETEIVSDGFIRFAMVAMTVHNVAAIIFRLYGGSKFYMQTFYYEFTKISETNRTFSWLYYDASEYALILLLTMAFFLTYKRLFKNAYLYWGAQGTCILCMLLTNVSIYYLATLLLFGGDFLHRFLQNREDLHKYLPYSYPVITFIYGVGLFLLTRTVDAFRTKALIWRSALNLLRETPEGMFVGFGVLTIPVPGIEAPVVQAQNTFLNHMLRHSLWTGVVFTILIATILILTFLKKPNLRSLCILLAILLPIILDFGLQTLHLPYVLFLLYTIFYRKGEKNHAL